MELEPKSLDVPLHPRSWFWAKLLAVLAAVSVALMRFAPSFGIPFAASTILALPVLAVYLFGQRHQAQPHAHRSFAKLAAFVGVLAYLGLAKRALAPALADWLSGFAL
jgi:hypothetical protein